VTIHDIVKMVRANEGISFTRSRPCRKYVNCDVEQKKYSMVRRKVGYQRFDTPAEGLLLNQLHD